MVCCTCQTGAPVTQLEDEGWVCSSCLSKAVSDGWNCGDKLGHFSSWYTGGGARRRSGRVHSAGCVHVLHLGRGEGVLNGHRFNRGRHLGAGVLAQARATVRQVWRQAGGVHQPVPFQVRTVPVTKRKLRSCKDSQ